MLDPVLPDRLQVGRDCIQRAFEADKFGDKWLVVALVDMVRDRTGHSGETDHILLD